MSSTDIISVDGVARTAQIVINDSGGSEITHYDYAAGMVTLAARPSTTVITVAELSQHLGALEIWKNLVNTSFEDPNAPRAADYDEIIRGNVDSVKLIFKINAVEVTNVKWRDNTQNIEFQPRPETVLTWVEFQSWYRALRTLLSRSNVFF